MISFFRSSPFVLSASLVIGLAACGGNEQVKDDPQPTAPPAAAEPEAAEPEAAPAEPEAAPVEAEAPPAFDENTFKGQAKVTAAKNAAGEAAFKVSSVKEGSGWEKCGIKSGDVLVSVAGVAVEAKKIDAVYNACAKGDADIMVERNGNAQKVGPLKSE